MTEIKFTRDNGQITALWSEVFGVSIEEIEFFLKNCKHKSCLALFNSGEIQSMLFLVDCSYCGFSGKYVYAVCTRKTSRNNGYASSLVEEAKKYMGDFLWLIPANDNLFNYYSRLGFAVKLYSEGEYNEKITFDEDKDIIEYLYEGSEYDCPKGMIYSKVKLPNGGTGFKFNEER